MNSTCSSYRSLVAMLAFFSLYSLTGCSTTEVITEETIKIGAIWSLTGSGAEIDLPAQRGAELAMRELNAADGVLGKQLELIVADAKSDSAGGYAAASRLADSGVIGYIGLNDTDPALGAGTLATSIELPFITSGATYPKLPERVGKSIFLACFGDNVQAAAGAEFVFDSLSKRKVFVLTNRSTTYTTALAAYFKTRWTELVGAGSIVGETEFDLGAQDISSQIAAINSVNPDFIFAAAVPDDLLNLIRQIRAAGITVPIAGGDGYDAPILHDSLTATETDSIYFTTHALVSRNSSLQISNFIDKYTSLYGAPPTSSFALLGYDAMMVLAEGLRRAGTTTPGAFFNGLEQISNFETLTGVLSYSASSHIPKKSVTLIAMRGGKPTLAGQLTPRNIPAP